jgi:hypothetical protein
MSESNFSSVVAVPPVTDHGKAVNWYQNWIWRAADVEPMEGVTEWQLAGNAEAVDPAGNKIVFVQEVSGCERLLR